MENQTTSQQQNQPAQLQIVCPQCGSYQISPNLTACLDCGYRWKLGDVVAIDVSKYGETDLKAIGLLQMGKRLKAAKFLIDNKGISMGEANAQIEKLIINNGLNMHVRSKGERTLLRVLFYLFAVLSGFATLVFSIVGLATHESTIGRVLLLIFLTFTFVIMALSQRNLKQ